MVFGTTDLKYYSRYLDPEGHKDLKNGEPFWWSLYHVGEGRNPKRGATELYQGTLGIEVGQQVLAVHLLGNPHLTISDAVALASILVPCKGGYIFLSLNQPEPMILQVPKMKPYLNFGVAFEELNVSYHNPETMLITVYPNYGHLN